MIVTVPLNPSLDRTMAVPRLEPGSVHRGQVLQQDPGGKGINVSRALQALGIGSTERHPSGPVPQPVHEDQ